MANQEHLSIFRQGANIWNQWRTDNPEIYPDLSYADLSYADLSDSTFSGDMSHADLSESNLNSAIFLGVNLSGATFQNTNFISVIFPKRGKLGFDSSYAHICTYKIKFDFGKTNFSYANFSHVNLTNALFASVVMENVKFTQANISNANFEKSNFDNINLDGANFIEVDLRDLDLKRYLLKGCNLSKSNLSGMDLKNINFEGTNLSGANLRGTLLSGTNLRRAVLSNANLDGAKCNRTDFSEANLESALLSNSFCPRAIFDKANLKNIKLNTAIIAHTTFQEANLQNAYLYAAYAVNANFSNADLSNAFLGALQALNANFYNADLTGVCIEDWNINKHTSFKNVSCKYFYSKYNKDFVDEEDEDKFQYLDRIPYNSETNFKEGEFEIFIQKAQNTVDLIFTNGIDWQAFLHAFLKLKSETGDELSIYSIEDKWDGYFVVRVNVPPDADKKEIETLLKVKNTEIEGYRRENTNLLNLLQSSLQKPSQSFHGDAYGVAASTLSQIINTPQPDIIQSSYNETEEEE